MIHQLRRARFEKGLTQYDLMAKTGIVQSRISQMEKGYYRPKPNEARKIAKVLGVKVEDVFPEGLE